MNTEKITVIIHGENCYLVLRRYGYADQTALNEYMCYEDDMVHMLRTYPDIEPGQFFDNHGYDKRVLSEEDLIRDLKIRFPIIEFIDERRAG